MKKILTPVTMALLAFSMFSLLAPKVKADTLSNDPILYAGGSDPGFVYKYAGGTEWELISPELGYAVLCLVEYEGHLYAGTTSEYGGSSGIGRVYRYDGGTTWTLVGDNMDHDVCSLAIYQGHLYAGTAWNGMKLYRYEGGTSWTQVIDSVVWSGTRSLYVSHDYLLMGDIFYDRFGRWDGSNFYADLDGGGSCIYDYQDYGDYVYAAAYMGRLWQSTDAIHWSVMLDYYDGNMWELEEFQNKLYMSYNNGELRAYDGTGSLRGELVYSAPDGIVSMTNDGNYLYFGTGGDAVGYGPESTGIANVYRYDGTDVVLISGEDEMVTGVQVLYVPVLPDLALVNIEPIQVILDAEALVAIRPTVIMISVQSTFPRRMWVDIFVFYDFGNIFYPERGPYGNGTPIDPGFNIVYLPGGPIYNETHEIYPSWTTDPPWFEWSGSGFDDEIEVWLDPVDRIVEADETNNQMVMGMKVVFPRRLRILIIPVYFPDIGQESFDPVMDYEREFLLATYPVAHRRTTPPMFEWRESRAIAWPGNPRYWNILQWRWEWRIDWLYENVVRPISRMAETAGWNRTVIVLQSLGDYDAWGLAPGMLGNPENRVPVIVTSRALEVLPGVVAHEIGHTFYLWHPHDIGPEIYDAYRYWVVRGDFGRGPAPNMNTFMSYRVRVGLEVWIDKTRFDTDFENVAPGVYEAPGDPVAGVPPHSYTLEFGMIRWNLMDQLTVNPHPEYGGSVILISGVMFRNGTIRLDPWYTLTGVPDIVNGTTGNYSITLTNGKEVIARMGFNASFNRLMEEDGILRNVEWDTIPFTLKIPYFPEAASIEIRDIADNILVTRTLSPNPPTVNVIYPNGGEILGGLAVHKISWEGYDPDGDILTYTIAYSDNNGETWIPLAIDINETSYLWNTSHLETGTNYLVKVIATDGVNTGEDISDNTFTILAGWTHVFRDSWRETELRINVKNKTFQFIAPDKDFGVREATYMRVRRRWIIIWHKDSEIKLLTISVDIRIDFCFAYAKDVETGERYLLVDKPGIE